MSNKFVIFALLGLATVYGQTPCSHTILSEPNLYEASSVVSKYEPVPAAQQLLYKDYLPPQAPFDFSLPQANQAAPVYIAPPHPQPLLPKLQPLPHTTDVKPVYQPKLQPLPSTVKPAYQPFPSFEKPVYQPLPKLQPLPQVPHRPVIQPLPKLQPLPSTLQPLPKLQPFASTPRPVISQTAPPSTFKSFPALPKLAVQPTPTFNRLPPLKPIQHFSPKQIVPPKSFQSRDNEVPQASNVQPKLARPDLEPAAQTNSFRIASPERLDKIRINHYICEQGDAQQKFLCDILKLWDLHHHEPPAEITSNDLDNPGDNSNNNPAYATLPTTPKPIPTTTRTTTTTPEPERDVEVLPGDSQQNLNTIQYLPPYTTTTTTTTTTTPAPTTVEIPKIPDPSNDNVNVIKLEKEGYEYPKPSIPFPVPEKEGYEYPKPSIPYSDGASFSSFSNVPLSSFKYPSPTFGSSLSTDGGFSNSLSQFRSGLASYSDNVQYKPLVSPVVTSTTIAPDLYFKSNSEFLSSPPFSYSFQPLPSVTYSDQTLSNISPYSLSTPAPPAVSYTSQPSFSQSLFTSTTTESPLVNTKASTEKSAATSTTSAPLPTSYNFQPIGQYYNSLSPISYSVPSYEGSLSSISPLTYNFDNSLGSFNSFNYQPLSSASFSNISPLPSTVSPLEKSSQISSEKSTLSSSAASSSSSFGSQQFPQYFNSPPPSFNYYFQPIEQSLTTASPLVYNYNDLSQGSKSNLTSVTYQSSSGQSLSGQPPVSYNFQPPSQSFASGQSYSFPASFNSGLPESHFVSSESPAITYTSSTPSPFNFPPFTSTQSPQAFQSFSSSSGSQSSHSSSSSSSLSSVSKSGLSFGSQAQSVADLKDLQATAKDLSLDLKFGGPQDNSLFGKEDDDARRKPNSSVEKEDVSLGNIEILKVKRKSPSEKH